MIPCGLFLFPIPAEEPKRGEAIRQVKHQLLGKELCYTSSGRPYLPGDYNRAISISHSKHWLAVCVAEPYSRAVGIDIEEKADQALRVLPRITTEAERRVMAGFGVTPLQLWTAKEAVYKAYSERLSIGITQVFIIGKDCFEVHCDGGDTLLQSVSWVCGNGFVLAHTLTDQEV